MTDFTLPELGENITAGDVVRVLVKPGDVLAKDQPILELETDKATIEVPSSLAGQVKEIRVKVGDKVKVGQSILSIEAVKGAAPAADAKGKKDKPTPPEPVAAKAPADEAPKPVDKAPVPAASARAPEVEPPSAEAVETAEGPSAPASPSVRRAARELGVDVSRVTGSGPSGRISLDDVKAHAKQLVLGAGKTGGPAGEPLPDFSRWGQVDRQPMSAIRRKTASHLGASWSSIPHVTQHERADITALEELRTRYAKRAEAAGGNLTVTAIALKVVASALKAFPQVNASIDLAADAIVYKKYVHIGVAVDTDRGLLVPVIRDVDTKGVVQLSVELAALSEKARSRKLSLDEMQGGCFTISNLGGIGGTAFTPIVNAPEVAILGISRARMEPVWQKGTGADGAFVPRLMLPLSLSYDHRVVDGAEGMRFLRWVVEALEQPFLLAL